MTLSIERQENLKSPQSESDFHLRDIVKTLPREVFIKNQRKAWTAVILNISLVIIGYVGLAFSPWYLLPFCWIFTGTALTGFFVLGHDCGHRSFANRRWVNDWVGHLMFLPLIYPFHGWRLGHNHHHKHTNKMGEDNAWQPSRIEDYNTTNPIIRFFIRLIRGKFWWIGSIFHWALVNFNWNKYEGKQREQVRFSALVVIGFAAITFPLLIATTGMGGFIKFWLMPWLVYHFWMSTFTIVHHTAPDIHFAEAEDWHEAKAQLSGTVHCNYPGWVEFLCHDINVHVPHHISTAIPFYNLRQAYSSLQQNWGEHLYRECDFSWPLMKEIAERCHLYDAVEGYQTFPKNR